MENKKMILKHAVHEIQCIDTINIWYKDNLRQCIDVPDCILELWKDLIKQTEDILQAEDTVDI